ncbi:HPr(Ser) kinase/phosphatase [Eubacteriales bacterium OttesenSCG-928-M02]|nr:HPr(Ser) kinase/phosphatase [Eubacteriales bacterium OttesenSCG-928-M02]
MEGKMIPVDLFAKRIGLETVYRGRGEFLAESSDVNRPSIQMTGYFGGFAHERIQLFGNQEMSYINQCSEDDLEIRLARFFSYDVPCILVCNGDPVPDIMLKHAVRNDVPVFKSNSRTSKIVHMVVDFLDAALAPEETFHANILHVYNVGIILRGESGIGKSELSLELIKRGHQIVADDVTTVRKIGETRLVGYAPEPVRYLMELRGVGIMDIRQIYGLPAVLETTGIDILVELCMWDEQSDDYERLGFDTVYEKILGVELPFYRVPVRPGRNLAVLVENIAMNFRANSDDFSIEQEVDKRLERLYQEGMNDV